MHRRSDRSEDPERRNAGGRRRSRLELEAPRDAIVRLEGTTDDRFADFLAFESVEALAVAAGEDRAHRPSRIFDGDETAVSAKQVDNDVEGVFEDRVAFEDAE